MMNRPRIPALLFCCLLILSACQAIPPAAPEETTSSKPRQMEPAVPPADQQALAEGNQAFAIDLYQTVRADQDGNLIVSPFSISQALAMTYAGARGQTEQEMAETLHFTLPQERLHPAFNALDIQLNQPAPEGQDGPVPFQLSLANSLWGQKGFPFLADFLDTLALNYGAGMSLVDYVNDTEGARQQINAWVSAKTNDKIKDLLKPGILSPDTRLVLVNAIYFKADWVVPFEPNQTQPAPFHRLDGSTVDTDFINGLVHVPYAPGDGYEALSLPYAGGHTSMLIIVPEQGRFEEVEASLTTTGLDTLLAGMEQKSLQLSMPKFKFESEFMLNEALIHLGMPSAFGNADFSGMTEGGGLQIAAVVHKAMIAVDEKGTEAAAATAVVMDEAAMPMADQTLTLDRPFIFIIRDDTTGALLFMGRVLDPSS